MGGAGGRYAARNFFFSILQHCNWEVGGDFAALFIFLCEIKKFTFISVFIAKQSFQFSQNSEGNVDNYLFLNDSCK